MTSIGRPRPISWAEKIDPKWYETPNKALCVYQVSNNWPRIINFLWYQQNYNMLPNVQNLAAWQQFGMCFYLIVCGSNLLIWAFTQWNAWNLHTGTTFRKEKVLWNKVWCIYEDGNFYRKEKEFLEQGTFIREERHLVKGWKYFITYGDDSISLLPPHLVIDIGA